MFLREMIQFTQANFIVTRSIVCMTSDIDGCIIGVLCNHSYDRSNAVSYVEYRLRYLLYDGLRKRNRNVEYRTRTVTNCIGQEVHFLM